MPQATGDFKSRQTKLCFKTIYPQDGEGFTAPTWANTAYLKSQISYLQLSKITLIKRTPCQTLVRIPSVTHWLQHQVFKPAMTTEDSTPVKSFQVPKGSEQLWRGAACAGDWFLINFHIMGSYQLLFPSLSGHRALQAEAGGWGSALSPRGWDLWSDCNGVSCTCSHNQHHGEKIQEQVWVASACWSPCHSLQIKAIAAKPEKLSGRVALKNESHLHWKMRAVHRPNTQPSNLLDTQSEMCTGTTVQTWNL